MDYGTCLENRRAATPRGFESHSFLVVNNPTVLGGQTTTPTQPPVTQLRRVPDFLMFACRRERQQLVSEIGTQERICKPLARLRPAVGLDVSALRRRQWFPLWAMVQVA